MPHTSLGVTCANVKVFAPDVLSSVDIFATTEATPSRRVAASAASAAVSAASAVLRVTASDATSEANTASAATRSVVSFATAAEVLGGAVPDDPPVRANIVSRNARHTGLISPVSGLTSGELGKPAVGDAATGYVPTAIQEKPRPTAGCGPAWLYTAPHTSTPVLLALTVNV